MMKLEQLQPNAAVRGIAPDALVTVVNVQWFGSEALELTYKTADGKVANQLLYRDSEPSLEIVEQGRPWSFDGDGALFRLVSEAQRIRLAHLFDPVLAVHTSVVDPLPHQIFMALLDGDRFEGKYRDGVHSGDVSDLMRHYDLPWNPNRLEQRFGRIHRIGQTEVCYLWNLLIDAIRYGDLPETKAFLTTVLDTALDKAHLQSLLDERQLVHDSMDASRVQRIREDMERADARRLQPHYIESFFLEAFRQLGGNAKQKEPRRFEVTHVPALVRNRDRLIGIGEPVLPRYERIAFEKNLVAPQGQPLAAVGVRVVRVVRVRNEELTRERLEEVTSPLLETSPPGPLSINGEGEDARGLATGGVGATAYAEAVGVYLTFAVDKCSDYWSEICSWHNSGEKMRNTFGRQAIPMTWDYAECRPRPPNAPTATRRDFLNALKTELPAALAHWQAGNIAPVDLAQAAIGPGMAVYTRFAKVLDAEGKTIPVRAALALINQVLDEALAEQEGDFDADTRWALAWFEQMGFAEGEYGIAEQLSKSKNTAVSGLVEAGILFSGKGKVRLLKPAELPADWDPTTDNRLTVWEMVHHLVRVLESGGESAAAALVAKLGVSAHAARELCYRLYSMCERKKRASEAMAYNALVQSWPEVERLARETPQAKAQRTGDLFE